MDLPDPDQLERLLEVLTDAGVTSFSCPSFTVHLNGAVLADDTDPDIKRVLEKREALRMQNATRLGNYAHPSLWQGREPPGFPRKEPAADRSPYQGDD